PFSAAARTRTRQVTPRFWTAGAVGLHARGYRGFHRVQTRREHRPASFSRRRLAHVLGPCPPPGVHKASGEPDLAHRCVTLEAPRGYRLYSCVKFSASPTKGKPGR